MKIIKYILFFFLITISVSAQVIQKDTTKVGYALTEKDSILGDTIHLEEIVIYKEKLNPEAQKQFILLRNRVYIAYPYAKLAAERLTNLNKGMASLTNNRDKKKYFKIVEDYLTNEFEAKLKKLSRKQGQILVKLIHRQTGVTTYELIRNLKSSWKAFWSNAAARMFDINLKTPYAPYQDNEDFLIETILVRAFDSGRLINQPPVTPIDYNNLNDFWVAKAIKTNK
ncbi:DUF4294 domain-containing protein [Flavobacterium sp.]|uniref:DUF4294 domain-containing protein n=1 Tax=Flavobacterium sp. TaxID=239 RepID=UPI0037B46304